MKLSSVCCWLLLATCSCGSSAENGTGAAPKVTPRLPDSCEPEVGVGDSALVDDFEDGDLLLATQATFHGLWYVNNDGSGTQSPAADDASAALLQQPGSPWSPLHALHTTGRHFTLWGAFAAARLNAAQGRNCTLDISGYSGVSLSVKGEGALRMNLGTVATTPADDGGECETDTCSDYGVVVELSADWQSVAIPFSDLSQPAWATTADWDPTRALRVSFWAEADDFDFWVDDLKFQASP
jgi:hypothetical protein